MGVHKRIYRVMAESQRDKFASKFYTCKILRQEKYSLTTNYCLEFWGVGEPSLKVAESQEARL